MKNINYNTIGIVAFLAIGAYFLFSKKQDDTTLPTENDQPQTPAPSEPQIINLNYNLMLKNGSRGNEVKELQRLLRITTDGIFGNQTEKALFTEKGVKQTTLNEYLNSKDVVKYKFKIADLLTATANVKFREYYVDAKDGYVPTNNLKTFENNQVIGRIIQLRKSADGKEPFYLVKSKHQILGYSFIYEVSEKFVK